MGMIKAWFNPESLELSNGKVVNPPKPITPYVIIALLIMTGIAIQVTHFDVVMMISRGHEFFVILRKLFPPDLGYMENIWQPLMDTIMMSFLGSAIGAIAAVPFAILSSQNINSNKILLQFIRFTLSILRTIPTLIVALIATYIFGIGTFSGTLATGIFTFGIVAKMLYEQIETVDMKPFEAMEALGATKLEAFSAAVMPQVLPTFLSIGLYTLELNVRYAAILGYVGAGGIGLLLDEKLGWREYDRVGMVLVMLFVTVVIIESLSRYLRERLT
ncbi:phosphonate ABC transporter, permease protein PhnE [Fusibacter bizertensis]